MFTSIIALYNAMDCNAIVWDPHQMLYRLMLERIKNKLIRYLCLFPGVFLMFLSLTFAELNVSSVLVNVMRGVLCNPMLFGLLGLCVPDRYGE